MHTFGTVYAGLWMRLPDSPERRLLADEKARGHNAYQAADALEALAAPEARRLSHRKRSAPTRLDTPRHALRCYRFNSVGAVGQTLRFSSTRARTQLYCAF